MPIESRFRLRPLPEIKGPQAPVLAALDDSTGDPTLGPLADLPGTWEGTGFNVIWRPNHTPESDHFLELNLTTEVLEFTESIGAIPNRGLLQEDIVMQGIRYLQQVGDANLNAGIHVEPGIWASVPNTTNPAEPATVVRMGSIPHGTSILAQGKSFQSNGAPTIKDTDIVPFVIQQKPTDPKQFITTFIEPDLSKPSAFRSPAAQLAGITQEMVTNPNSVLQKVLQQQKILSTTTLVVSTDPQDPIVGGGTANTAFLRGIGGPPNGGPNADAVTASSIFWIEKVAGQYGGPDFLQLQYTQLVLLNFATLSWPHVSVATLRKRAPVSA